MKYYVKNSEVYGVRVRYRDAWDELRTREGSYLGDSLLLTGFTEAQQSVPAQISFFDRSMVESETIDATFDTENSATVALFDSLKVQEFWGGFSVTYTAPEIVSGMVHVFYLGTNPQTGKLDSILMSSTPIKEGGDTLNFEMSQVMETTDVIVRTDDFDGKRVKLQVYENLPCLSMDSLKYEEDFRFEFGGTTVTNSEYGLGLEYLFDGDKNGIGYRRNKLAGNKYIYNTYVVGPNAFYDKESGNNNRFILDLQQDRVPAAVYIYAFLNYQTSWPRSGSDVAVAYPDLLADIWNGYYLAHLPAKAKLYGTNDDPRTVDLSSCVLLSELDEDPESYAEDDAWIGRTDSYTYTSGWREDWTQGDEKDAVAADPGGLRMLCNYEAGRKFRYLILVVTDTYNVPNWYEPDKNAREYITFNELEVYIKAE